MIITEITYPSGKTGIQLAPENEWLTNGQTFSKQVFLSKDNEINDWHDTNDEPPEQATEEDYIEALERLGV